MSQQVELYISQIGQGAHTVTFGVFDGVKDFEVTVPVYYTDQEALAEILRVKDMLDHGVGILGP